MCYIMYLWYQALPQDFSSGKISAFFAKIFFKISFVILNSSLHYQIFKFDTTIIQILVWIIGIT